MRLRHGFAIALIACAFAVAGCGGGGGGDGTSPGTGVNPGAPVVPAAPTPTPTPTPGPLTLSSAMLQFTEAGQKGTFSANEPGFFGNFTATSLTGHLCTGIATFTPATIVGPNPTFSVTAVAAGTCVIVVTDAYGQTAQETVYVTTTSGSISAIRRN